MLLQFLFFLAMSGFLATANLVGNNQAQSDKLEITIMKDFIDASKEINSMFGKLIQNVNSQRGIYF